MKEDISEFANAMREIITKSDGKDNGADIIEGDFGFFRSKKYPRVFLKHRNKDFVEAHCLCPQCHHELSRNDKRGFGHNVNELRSDYTVIGNLSQINIESL